MGQDDLDKEMADLKKPQKSAKPAPQVYVAEHTVVAGDSMSGIAQQY